MEIMENQAIKIPSKTDSIHIVESLIDDVCDGLDVNEDHYGNILIAVTEAVTNAIQHGNKHDSDKNIDVSYDVVEQTKLSFTIEDQGEGFDPTALPDPTDPKNIENPHGRGIFLMKHLADAVEFDQEGRLVKLDFDLTAN